MPTRTTSKYSKEKNALLEGEVMLILAESAEALTIPEIQEKSLNLTGITSQKIARILNHLVEMGLIKKAKNRSLNRMAYKSTAVMIEQGYEI